MPTSMKLGQRDQTQSRDNNWGRILQRDGEVGSARRRQVLATRLHGYLAAGQDSPSGQVNASLCHCPSWKMSSFVVASILFMLGLEIGRRVKVVVV
jgi:hypothetical protein